MNNKKGTNKSIEINKTVLVAIIVLVIIIIVSLVSIIINLRSLSLTKTNATVEVAETEEGKPIVNGAAGVIIKGREKEKALASIGEAMKDIRSKAVMLTVEDSSEESPIMVYNSHGEIMSEESKSGIKVVYLNNHKAIMFGEQLAYGYDSDVLSLMEIVYELANKYNATMLRVYEDPIDISVSEPNTADTHTEEQSTTEKYFIDIRGWDAIKTVYDMIGTGFGTTMVNILKQSADSVIESLESQGVGGTNVGKSNSGSTSELGMRFTYMITDNQLEAGICYIFANSKESARITWTDMKINWKFDSILTIPDWELRDAWYITDWAKLPEMTADTGLMDVEQLFSDQYRDLVELLSNVYKESEEQLKSNTANDKGIEDNNDTGITVDSDGNAIFPTIPILNTDGSSK